MLVIQYNSIDCVYIVYKHGYTHKIWVFDTADEVIEFRNGFFGIFKEPELPPLPVWVTLSNSAKALALKPFIGA